MFLRRFLILFMLGIPALSAHANIPLTDLAGRQVVLDKPAKKVVLGEGRFLSIFGVLGIQKPLDYVAGMMNEFELYDPETFAEFAKVYPEINSVPIFGQTSEQSVSVEKIIALEPDLAIFGLNGHGPGARSNYIIDQLDKAGIKIIFIDFRQDPVNNTAKSVQLVADALGMHDKGQVFAEFYQREIKTIQNRVAKIPQQSRPKVLFELRASQSQECCLTVAQGMFAAMAEVAGGISVAEGVLPGPVGSVSHEFALRTPFDVYIGTATGSPQHVSDHLMAGPNVSEKEARQRLNQLMGVRHFDNTQAFKQHRTFVLWHHFYNSPLNIYAIQKMATWFHPSVFNDIQPEQTLITLLDKFKPVELGGIYGI